MQDLDVMSVLCTIEAAGTEVTVFPTWAQAYAVALTKSRKNDIFWGYYVVLVEGQWAVSVQDETGNQLGYL
jgi:hypothetical protein